MPGFIPVISRTYCDPKSFAWEHEFKAFVENASADKFGLRIKLPKGNVAGRVLPVRIHDLESEDVKLCESITEGVLRGVEFIYKEPGVNRPLVPDDDEKVNLNKTKYRNQINKVANAIHDIIKGMRMASENGPEPVSEQDNSVLAPGTNPVSGLNEFITKNILKRKYLILLAFIPVIITLFFILKTNNLYPSGKSLALIPLRFAGSDSTLKEENEYFIEALTNKLNILKKIEVKPSFSILSYRNTGKSYDEIIGDLDAVFVLTGNIRREGNIIKIWLELIESESNKLLWSDTFQWERSKAAALTTDLSKIIAEEMNISLTPEEANLLLHEPSGFPEASNSYYSANIILRDAWTYFNYGHKMLDSVSFMSAIETYDKAIKADTMFALAYAKRAQAITWGIYDGQLDSTYRKQFRSDINRALRIDNSLPDIQTALGLYHYFCEVDYLKSLDYFNNACRMDPGNYQPLYYQSLVYRKMGMWDESYRLIKKVISFNPNEALFLTNIGLSFDYMHKYDSAIIFHQRAIDLVPGWIPGHVNKIQSILLRNGDVNSARIALNEAVIKTGDPLIESRIQLSLYERDYDSAYSLAQKSHSSDYIYDQSRLLYLARISFLQGDALMTRMYSDSAVNRLTQLIKIKPDDAVLHALLSVASAYSGDSNKATNEGEKAIILSNRNKMQESDMKVNLALVCRLINDHEKSASLLSNLLNTPSAISPSLIKIDPLWSALLQNPDFQKIFNVKLTKQ